MLQIGSTMLLLPSKLLITPHTGYAVHYFCILPDLLSVLWLLQKILYRY